MERISFAPVGDSVEGWNPSSLVDVEGAIISGPLRGKVCIPDTDSVYHAYVEATTWVPELPTIVPAPEQVSYSQAACPFIAKCGPCPNK